MPQSLPLNHFLQKPGVLFDVRSPAEYQQGHIPYSFSLPLFSDEERAKIGTAYKQQSREAAIDLGLQVVGPKLLQLVQQAKPHLKTNEGKILCWRGGMRSGFVARLFESIGLPTTTLQGGYQAFRRWVLKTLSEQPLTLYVVGGLTGSSKTEVLHLLKAQGEQVLDLEAFANHRGSAFGSLGLSGQPSQEHFENLIAYQLNQWDLQRPIWVEDESRLIGTCCIPTGLYRQMAIAPLFYLSVPKEQRLIKLLRIYGQSSKEDLSHAAKKLTKRLGGERLREVLELFDQDNKLAAFDILLTYYDKAYQHHLSQRNPIFLIQEASTEQEYADQLQHFIKCGQHVDSKFSPVS